MGTETSGNKWKELRDTLSAAAVQSDTGNGCQWAVRAPQHWEIYRSLQCCHPQPSCSLPARHTRWMPYNEHLGKSLFALPVQGKERFPLPILFLLWQHVHVSTSRNPFLLQKGSNQAGQTVLRSVWRTVQVQ